MTRLLHVANGTSTTRLIEAAGIPGERSIWADPLYEGPVPAGLSDDELLDVRRRFLAGPGGVTLAARRGSDPSLDPVNDMRQWRAVIARQESYDELILWFEHDLFDQLNLIQLLTWIRERLPSTRPVSLISVRAFPGRPDFKGLGELTPSELGTLLGTRQRVSLSQYATAERAWKAFRAPTPAALDDFRRSDSPELPYLTAALTRFLEEYPFTSSGLSRTERRLLELADGDGISLQKSFPRMHEGEQVYYVTDASLAAMAEGLSVCSPPLLILDAASPEHDRGLHGIVTLTDNGRAALEGRLDRVRSCGIDRWLGGVHLQGRGPTWRWDEARQSVLET